MKHSLENVFGGPFVSFYALLATLVAASPLYSAKLTVTFTADPDTPLEYDECT